jgi:hypothetical protein
MGVRRKGRAKFDFRGRTFVWYVSQDTYVRIASADKRYSVSYNWYDSGVLKVSGAEFPGLDAAEKRPVYLILPRFTYPNLGALVNSILSWSFDERQPRKHAEMALSSW